MFNQTNNNNYRSDSIASNAIILNKHSMRPIIPNKDNSNLQSFNKSNNSNGKELINYFPNNCCNLKEENKCVCVGNNLSNSNNQNLNQIHKKLSKKYSLQKKINFNLSTQKKVTGCFKYANDTIDSNKIIIDETFIKQAKEVLQPFITDLIKAIKKKYNLNDLASHYHILNKEINSFCQNHFIQLNMFVKFFLQIDDRLLYIPTSFGNIKDFKKEDLNLFEGFDSTKHICLKYYPTCSSEV